MNTSLGIWLAYHILILIAHSISSDVSSRGFFFSFSMMSLIGGSALMWAGHDQWFLFLNLLIVGFLSLAAMAAYGTAPPGSSHEKASLIAQATVIRFAVTLACWFCLR